jgi:pilus assembly protein CpaB
VRFKPIIMIGLAVVFGGSAILVGNSWLAKQAAQQRPAASPAEQAAPMSTIVVASSALRYGDEVTGMKLKQIPWPAAALPAGAFATVDDVAKGGKRIVLSPMEPNEPVLRGKITGEGERATVSMLIDENMGAVTIQVDEVIGLAGLVLPGDRVDVFVTQKQSSDDNGGTPIVMTDRVIQNVRVLAVGQSADSRLDKPSVVRAVTIEVTPAGAQKVAVATRLGSLSLMLRKAGETTSYASRRMTGSEMVDSGNAGDGVSVRVARGTKEAVYAVPRLPEETFPADPTYATGNTRSGPKGAAARRTPETVARPLPEPDLQ